MEEKKQNDLINYIFEDYLKKSGYKDTLFTFYKETNKNIDEINNQEIETSIYTSLNLNKNENDSIIHQIIKKNYNENFLNEFYTNSMKFEESFIKKLDELNITNNEVPNIIKDINETKYFKKNSKEEKFDDSIKNDEKQNDSIKNDEKQKVNNINESFDRKNYKNSISVVYYNKNFKKNNNSKENLNSSLKNKTINESFKSQNNLSTNKSLIKSDIKQCFFSMKNFIKNYHSIVKKTESQTKKILKSKYKAKKIKNLNKTVINKKESFEFEDVSKTGVIKKKESKSNSCVLSKYLYFLYYEKYQFFKEENKKEIINFDLKCSVCQKNIKNKIFCFINKDPEINNINNDYYICNKCFRETISETNSNLLSKFFMDFKPEEEKTNDYDIFIDFQKLTLNGEEIKSNGEINLYHMYCLKEYEFVLQFKYINCSNGEIKQLYLHKNDGSDIVPVEHFKKNQTSQIKFKFKKLDKNYIGRFKKQIFFKSKDKKESEKFTFFINILKIPNNEKNIENDETLDKSENSNKNNQNDKENNSKNVSNDKKDKINDDDYFNDKAINNESNEDKENDDNSNNDSKNDKNSSDDDDDDD